MRNYFWSAKEVKFLEFKTKNGSGSHFYYFNIVIIYYINIISEEKNILKVNKE